MSNSCSETHTIRKKFHVDIDMQKFHVNMQMFLERRDVHCVRSREPRWDRNFPVSEAEETLL